ncbi:MAG: tRNA lysidine(34) synthetase TilS [Planctomycetes bacterium]|nr:tRNA lysidine(34) synthetase TilS [Planctomycetota bacterium]
MLLNLENKVADFIKANSLFGSADRILLAVSGGADSTALLHAIRTLKNRNIVSADVLCAHLNHQLRPADAQLDEDFVIEQARALKFAIVAKRLDVRSFARKNKLSIETAARKLRIETLIDIAKNRKCNSVATAHHKNDNAETLLHRLVRGTGFRGLAGIWPARVFAEDIRFVRPLLSVTRDEIIEYLCERNLKWRRDHTNDDCTYTRNFIRHRLLPALQKDCTGSLVEQLSDLADSAGKFYTLVCNWAQKAWPQMADCSANMIKLNVQMFLAQPPSVKVELVRRSLTAVGSGQRDLTSRHFKRILKLAEQNVGRRKIELPAGFVVRREYGNLLFTREKKTTTPRGQISESAGVQVPGQTRFGQYVIEATALEADDCRIEKFKTEKTNFVEWFDLEKLKLPLEVRSRKAGDRFWPLGLDAEKKVGKFLTAAKVPHNLRRKLLIIQDSEKIILLWPIRMSQQAKITGRTKKILQLQITDTNPAH